MKFPLREDLVLGYYSRKRTGCRYCEFARSLSIVWFNPEIHLSHKSDLSDGDPQCVDKCPVKVISFILRTETIRMMEN
jgi:Fe-S-cluster-containing dehydrogenase component